MRPVTLITLLILLGIPRILLGSDFRAKDDIIVDSDEIVRDDLYLFGNSSDVRGDVEGDLSAFCYDIISSGEIGGGANIFAYDLDLTGRVAGTVRIFAFTARVNAPIEGNVVGLGSWLRFGNKAVISRDIDIYAERITFDGTARGKFTASGDEVKIAGTIYGDVEVDTKRLLIVDPAVIKGNLIYKSREKAVIEDGVVIEGETTWDKKDTEPMEEASKTIGIFNAGFKIALLVMSFVTGLLIILLCKDHAREASLQVQKNFWYTLAVGFLTFIILSGGALVSMVLIIGIPLSLIMIMIGMVLFYIGKIYAAIPLGNWVLNLISKESKPGIILQFLIGLIILTILFRIPYFGMIIYIGAFVLGAGAIVQAIISMRSRLRSATAGPPAQ